MKEESGNSSPTYRLPALEVGVSLPRFDDEIFLLQPYETERVEASYPIMYVAVLDETRPLDDKIEEKEGSLLLFRGRLYERRNGVWEKKQRAVPRAMQPPRPAKAKKKARKKRK